MMVLDVEKLRHRQTELVRELAVEVSTVELGALSHELEKFHGSWSQLPQSEQIQNRSKGTRAVRHKLRVSIWPDFA